MVTEEIVKKCTSCIYKDETICGYFQQPLTFLTYRTFIVENCEHNKEIINVPTKVS